MGTSSVQMCETRGQVKNTCWVIECSFLKRVALNLLDMYFLSFGFFIDILLVGEGKVSASIWEKQKNVHILFEWGRQSAFRSRVWWKSASQTLMAALGGSVSWQVQHSESMKNLLPRRSIFQYLLTSSRRWVQNQSYIQQQESLKEE